MKGMRERLEDVVGYTKGCKFMTNIRMCLSGALIAMVVLSASESAYADPSVSEIMDANFYTTKAKTVVTDQQMILENDKGQQRVRSMTTYSKLRPSGAELSLVVKFNLPADVQGTTFLQMQNVDDDDDMWIYLPALKKTRRLVSANKRDSFVGSDFSYGDVLTLRPTYFQHVLLRSEMVDNYDCFVVESVPKDRSKAGDFGYSKKTTWLRKDNYLELKVEYFNENNELIKTQKTGDHKLLEAQPPRWIAQKREMINHESGHKTIVLITKTDTEKALADTLFTARSIETK
jgi:hypothetical protein